MTGGDLLRADLLAHSDGHAGNRDLLDDFDFETLERGNVSRGIGEQADLVDAEVGEDLAAETNLSKDALVLVVLRKTDVAMEENAVRIDRAVDVESPTGVVEIDERTASGFGDETQGLLHDVVAVAGGGGEDISREAVGMNADEDGLITEGLVSADVALDQREMAFAAVDFALVGDDAELAIRPWVACFLQRGRCSARSAGGNG